MFFFSKVVLIILFVFPARPRTNLLISFELQWETVQKGLCNVTLVYFRPVMEIDDGGDR